MLPNKVRRSETLFYTILAVSAITALVVLLSVEPSKNPYLPKCLLHLSTGLHCTGCGATRCLHALFSGKIVEAFRYHLLMPIALLLFCVYRILKFRYKNGTAERRYWGVCIGFAIVIIMLFTILRNVPLECFVWLRPPNS